MRVVRAMMAAMLFSLAAAPVPAADVPTPLAKSVEVTVTNVDVVVTDKKGNPVTDLKPEDFELKEDGARQALTHLALVDNGLPSAGAPSSSAEINSPGPSAPSI